MPRKSARGKAAVTESPAKAAQASAPAAAASDEPRVPAKRTRYAELPSSTVAPAHPMANGQGKHALVSKSNDDESDSEDEEDFTADAAEPSLATRLKALQMSKAATPRLSAGAKAKASVAVGQAADEDDKSDADDQSEAEGGASDGEAAVATGSSARVVPATTLTTTLVQALHSSDVPLLESCLAHGSPKLIRSTVKRLPSGSQVLALLEALVDRLGKGRKGTEGLASVKRARSLVEWLRQVLIVHVGFLVTVSSTLRHASRDRRLTPRADTIAREQARNLACDHLEPPCGPAHLACSQRPSRARHVADRPSTGTGGGACCHAEDAIRWRAKIRRRARAE